MAIPVAGAVHVSVSVGPLASTGWLLFSTGALLVVCAHCNLASWRTDVKLERIGKVAELAPIESPIALGAEGRVDGHAFRVAGVVELDHGRGPWHEWAIRFDDGAWAWLAEAQGQYLVTRAADVELASVPVYARVSTTF